MPLPLSPSWDNPKIWPSSCAIMKALESPSSLFKEQLRPGSHTPSTGAYPEGPPIFNRVSQIAISCLDVSGKDDQNCSFHLKISYLFANFLKKDYVEGDP